MIIKYCLGKKVAQTLTIAENLIKYKIIFKNVIKKYDTAYWKL